MILREQHEKPRFSEKILSHKQEHNAEQKETEHDTLFRKIDSITKTCINAYFNKIQNNLAQENPENATITCYVLLPKKPENYHYDGIHVLAEK